MESIDVNNVSQVLHNPETDVFEVYVFGQKVESYVDELPAAELCFHLTNMYQRGRLDVARLIETGFVTSREIILAESETTAEDLDDYM